MNIFVAILIISDFVVLSFRFLILISPFHIKLQFGQNQTWLCPNYKPQRKSCQYESIKNPTELCINSTIVLLLYLLSQTGGHFLLSEIFLKFGCAKVPSNSKQVKDVWKVTAILPSTDMDTKYFLKWWRHFCRHEKHL